MKLIILSMAGLSHSIFRFTVNKSFQSMANRSQLVTRPVPVLHMTRTISLPLTGQIVTSRIWDSAAVFTATVDGVTHSLTPSDDVGHLIHILSQHNHSKITSKSLLMIQKRATCGACPGFQRNYLLKPNGQINANNWMKHCRSNAQKWSADVSRADGRELVSVLLSDNHPEFAEFAWYLFNDAFILFFSPLNSS